jgi:hypothetical protein
VRGQADPGVNDELAVPAISMTKSGDEPPVKEFDTSWSFLRRDVHISSVL